MEQMRRVNILKTVNDAIEEENHDLHIHDLKKEEHILCALSAVKLLNGQNSSVRVQVTHALNELRALYDKDIIQEERRRTVRNIQFKMKFSMARYALEKERGYSSEEKEEEEEDDHAV
jgi:hypothetical protein